MSTPRLFMPEDLKQMRQPTLVLGVCLVLPAIVYFGTNTLSASASAANQSAQSQYAQVQTSIQQIASEEATFVEYIDRYRLMEENRVFADEDRLALVEFVQSIRQQSRMYPIDIEIGEQGSEMLAYPPEELLPGQPVQLRYSNVTINFNSLHEEDFANLISQFIQGRGLFIPETCSLSSVVEDGAGFVEVAPNLLGQCNLVWFTLSLNPEVPPDGA